MRQYLVLATVFILAFASFFFFVINDGYERALICENGQFEDREKNGAEDEERENGNGSNGESNGEENGETSNGDNGEGNGEETNGENGETNGENGTINGNEEESGEIVWGVDSASLTTEELFACVTSNFGDPEIWGRYLEDKEGVSYGLTTDEVDFLHEQGVSILVIYNHFTDGTTYEKGVAEAEQAIAYAEEIGVPEQVAIFANVEPEYPIDSAFIQGWYDTLQPSIYYAAIYGLFDEESDVYVAYEGAINENPEIAENMIVWANQPQIGITTEENAPEDYNPAAPNDWLNWAWQYGIDAETCNIDTNLFQSIIFDYLWQPE
ncbi:glycoside hydrolase domain-containing protein [Alkalihalobacterium elongatum]|uniref:glycoside hydrolase domain-containing protein n=1 Tax=Alkalihalobacterium elongatum TaxID=2675466 RepID=UPI002E2DEF58|nr:glycoside hydrolase domain-containing protein [Alkalihalobacterium elongatum]